MTYQHRLPWLHWLCLWRWQSWMSWQDQSAVAQTLWELRVVIIWNNWNVQFITSKRAFDLNDEHPKNVKPWPSSVHPPEKPWPVVLSRGGYNLVRGQHINPSNTLDTYICTHTFCSSPFKPSIYILHLVISFVPIYIVRPQCGLLTILEQIEVAIP